MVDIYDEILKEGERRGAIRVLTRFLASKFPAESRDLDALLERCTPDELDWFMQEAINEKHFVLLRNNLKARLLKRCKCGARRCDGFCMEESEYMNMYNEIISEGHKKGFEEGFQEGMRDSALRSIHLFLEHRFPEHLHEEDALVTGCDLEDLKWLVLELATTESFPDLKQALETRLLER